MKRTFKCSSNTEVRSALEMCSVLFEDISCIKRLFFSVSVCGYVFICLTTCCFWWWLIKFRFYHPSLGYLLMLMMTDLGCYVCDGFHDNSSTDISSTTLRLKTFRLQNFVYYCIPAYRTVIHPTSVSANHYFHQFQLLLTLWFLFINPTSTYTMIIRHI